MPKFSPDGSAQLALIADPEGHVVGLTEYRHAHRHMTVSIFRPLTMWTRPVPGPLFSWDRR